MSKPRTPNQRKKYNELNTRLAKYVALVEEIYEILNEEASRLVSTMTDYEAGGNVPFRWSDYPQTRDGVGRILDEFVEDIGAVIYRGTSDEWKNSEDAQNLLAKDALRAYAATVAGERYRVLFETNGDALRAFQQRKDKGMTLSEKLWDQSESYKKALEDAISCAIKKGTSAVALSKQVSRYLKDFPSLRKDYGEMFGRARKIEDCEYRSVRLARSEINMAYRSAENLKWQQMDFIVGFEIKLSGSHHVNDICDRLKGKYPKSFVWTGWHPNDMCFKIPVFKTDEEFMEWNEDNPIPSVNEVKDVPDEFKKWMLENEARIERARKKGTLPYFISDNSDICGKITLESSVKEIMNKASASGDYVQAIAEGVAARLGGRVTPINFKSSSSITRKVKTEGITPYDIKDAVRTTIIVQKDRIEDALEELSEHQSFLRLKRQRPESFMGYSGNIVNINTGEGVVAEIQVNTEKMIYAKEKPEDAKKILGEEKWNQIKEETGMEGGLGHMYYEEFRVLDRKSSRAKDIAQKSIEYYSHFQ